MYFSAPKMIFQKSFMLLFTAILFSACSHATVSQPPAEPAPAPVASSDVYRFKVGALEAVALRDGDIVMPNDGKTIWPGQSPTTVGALLAQAGLPTHAIEFSIQPLLVRDGERTLLFDTGAGNASFARAGRLPTSLRAAGLTPLAVTDVFVTHAHPDHVGGLVTSSGTLAFPNARIHMAAAEWASLKGDAKHEELVAVIAPKVVTFEPDASILPNVSAVSVRGHTPGHSAYRITSNGEQLLVTGDAAHHSIVSLQRPDWTISFDLGGRDEETARATRQALLQRVADEHVRLYVEHFPFPGVGHIQRSVDGFVWVPESAGPARPAGAR